MAECLMVSSGDSKRPLLRTGEAYVSFARANPALYRLMFGEGFPTASKSAQAARDLRQKAYDIMKSVLAERFPKADLPIAGLFLWSVVHGLALLMIDAQIEPEDDAEDVIRGILQLGGKALARGTEG